MKKPTMALWAASGLTAGLLGACLLAAVRTWYAQRLHVSPGTANLYASGDCAWLNQARHGMGLKYEATVLLCSEPQGTRIAVRERVGLWP